MTQQMTLDWARQQGDAGILRAQVRAENAAQPTAKTDETPISAVTAVTHPGTFTGTGGRAWLTGLRGRTRWRNRIQHPPTLREGARVVGLAPRRKGHGSSGGNVYGVAL